MMNGVCRLYRGIAFFRQSTKIKRIRKAPCDMEVPSEGRIGHMWSSGMNEMGEGKGRIIHQPSL